MATINVRVCDICGGAISPGLRRFTGYFDVTLTWGTPTHRSAKHEDLCSERCLLTAVTGLIEALAREHATVQGPVCVTS